MPIHDWTKVKSGQFHDFHQDWVIEIRRALNNGLLPPGYSALTDHGESESDFYARKANRLSIQSDDNTVVAIIEVVSPGNKKSRVEIDSFKSKIVNFLRRGVSVVLVDLFPPTRRDPEGLHHLIWSALTNQSFAPCPDGKPLTVAGYDAGGDLTAYVDPVAVGDPLPDAPLFLAPGWYVNIPLEETYMKSWSLGPKSIRELFERS